MIVIIKVHIINYDYFDAVNTIHTHSRATMIEKCKRKRFIKETLFKPTEAVHLTFLELYYKQSNRQAQSRSLAVY